MNRKNIDTGIYLSRWETVLKIKDKLSESQHNILLCRQYKAYDRLNDWTQNRKNWGIVLAELKKIWQLDDGVFQLTYLHEQIKATEIELRNGPWCNSKDLMDRMSVLVNLVKLYE